ncbi:type II secretion system protein [Pandoraea sp.]|uniref:type II secretion system protein n=1 Tax=Pandoraea sp. TaxID=1883445 RepID=UPI00120917C4|nr:type II secretion system protein [Pandoraea sp.]TAL53574.1 MAG: type II secretion system protein [Pandoraea sp.]TAM14883.1 MAG: type II secretion system protein [Pandoraea sp.]
MAYLGVLVAIAIAGAWLYQVAGSRAVGAQREKEAQLLFAGDQIARAIGRYYASGPVPGCYPPDLQALLDDHRLGGVTQRHLRHVYADPMTGKTAWGELRDELGNLRGVYSTSDASPYKQANFPAGYRAFAGKQHYREWHFLPADTRVPPAPPEACLRRSG